MTGGLDEVQIGNIKQQLDKLTELKKRKDFIISSIEEQGMMSDELKQRILSSWDSTVIEDIYLPYKPKRMTKAEVPVNVVTNLLQKSLWHRMRQLHCDGHRCSSKVK